MNLVKNLMTEYFSESDKKENLLQFNNKLPVSPKKTSWKVIENNCLKYYNFKQKKVAIKFSLECMKHSLEADTDFKVTYYKTKVIIKIVPPSGYVTEIEKELMDELDYLYRSIKLENAK